MTYSDEQDRLMDVLLAEVAGSEAPPDLTERILARGYPPQVAAPPPARPRQAAGPRRWRLVRWAAAAAAAAVAVAAAVLLLVGGAARTPYPEPQAEGSYAVLWGDSVSRGAVLRTGAGGARLTLGGYCRVSLDPDSLVRIEGTPHCEQIFLEEGRALCDVDGKTGQFVVETDLCTVSVQGTRFTVQLSEQRGEQKMPRRQVLVNVLAGLVAVSGLWGQDILTAGQSKAVAGEAPAIRDEGTCGPPPPPKPAQRSGAEGFAPLPLPATPQRRTEKKKPPTPPVVVVKIKTGTPADWATDQNDINNLLVWMQTKLKINFTYEEKPLSEVPLDAARLPMLYRTGHNAFTFSESERSALREYILKGGFIVFDSCCGKKDFADSVRKEMAAIFPERPLKRLEADHPLYRCYYDVATVQYTPAAGIGGQAPPPLEGIDIGCRTGVVFSPVDLSCGWDMHTHARCAGVYAEDALKLGANLIAYATSTKAMGTSLAESRVYVDRDASKADKFRIGQVLHAGDGNPDPAGLSTLLDTVSATSTMKVSFATQPLKLDSGELTTFPFLYMTGHSDFTLTDPEAAALRKYLKAGGFLMADACCGRRAFDAAFRREMKKVLPDHQFTAVDPKHPIFSTHYKIGQVNYSQAAVVQRKLASPGPANLEGIMVNGELAVVYTPFDMGCGWELKPHPYGIGYESRDAVQLGVNVVLYAVTH
jgi:hypothetical protein